jgi:hypothetical protein
MSPRQKHALTASLLAAGLALGCGQSGESRPAEPASTAGRAAPAASSSSAPALAPPALLDPNPLHLPSRTLALDAGRRVFTVSEQTLAGAKLGSTLILQAATVTGFDGELLVIDGANGPYKVHPAYAIAVPDKATIRPGYPVITERNGLLRHAVVKKHVRDRVTVRFTDEGLRHGELILKNTRFIVQTDGLHPGSFAALGEGETLRHVLLTWRDPGSAGRLRWARPSHGTTFPEARPAAQRESEERGASGPSKGVLWRTQPDENVRSARPSPGPFQPEAPPEGPPQGHEGRRAAGPHPRCRGRATPVDRRPRARRRAAQSARATPQSRLRCVRAGRGGGAKFSTRLLRGGPRAVEISM